MPAPEITFYNTLTHRGERFVPIDPPRVYMYNCGPTVYDYAHIGNFKTFLFADVLRRFLELVGYDVRQVMNLTDVGHMTEDDLADGGGEDKMQAAANRLLEAKKSGKLPPEVDLDANDPYAVAQFYTDAFIEDAKLLGMKIANEYPAQTPKATEHVGNMQAMVQKLIDKGHAYVASDGAVYFSVQSFSEYGKLSGNTLENLRGGAGGRVQDNHQQSKRHPADFLLWKPDNTHLMKWDSPWGAGYPGWHIECSAMAKALLGRDTIDIHTGGEDNIFPHHECEIAQSRGASGEDRFASFWMHSRHLMVEGQKMSKSKKNFFTVGQILAGQFTGRPVDPAVLRLELIRARYRSRMDFTRAGLESAASNIQRLRDLRMTLQATAGSTSAQVDTSRDEAADFLRRLGDDLDTAGAWGVVNGTSYRTNGSAQEASADLALLDWFDQVFAVLKPAEQTSESSIDPEKLCASIDAARAAKDFAQSDTVRQQLIDAGYDVKTTPNGTVAIKKLA
ncbi:MAG: cysteine--tRNA ligase [Planctomycetota bacterium]